jgi:hypothetical protein
MSAETSIPDTSIVETAVAADSEVRAEESFSTDPVMPLTTAAKRTHQHTAHPWWRDRSALEIALFAGLGLALATTVFTRLLPRRRSRIARLFAQLGISS